MSRWKPLRYSTTTAELTRDLKSLFAAVALTLAVSANAFGDTSATLNQEGVKAFGSGDIDSAVFYFKQALQLDSRDETIRTNLSNAYDAQAAREFEKGRQEYAIQLLEEAMAANPTNPGPFIRLGYFFLQMEENDNAIFRLEDAIELAPNNAEAHFLLGEAYYRDNDVNSALEQWEWVHTVKPSLPGLKERLATARREAKVEGEYDYQQSRRFSVTHNPDLSSSDVRRIIRILDSAYNEVGRNMNNAFPPGPIQVTLYAAEEFSDSTLMGAHIGAIFDGTRIRLPVITAEGDLVPQDQLQEVLYHEYVHVVVKYLAPRGVPWWINEGLAEALSHELSDAEERLLKYAQSNGGLFPMAQLVPHQLEQLPPEQLGVAYAQAHAVTEYLIQQCGMLNVVSILKRIDGGESAEDALRRSCRTTYETLDMALAGLIDEL